MVAEVNKYISDSEPWKIKDDPERLGTILHVTAQCVADLNVILSPFDNDITQHHYARKMFMSVYGLSLLGLGLGIDYALFFVSRFREELEDYPTVEAVPRTVASAP